MTISELVEVAFKNADEHGFHSPDENIPEKLALIHSEVSEALESFRVDGVRTYMEGTKPEGFGVELADVVIRVADLCGSLGIDLEKLVMLKMAYNATRSFKHGKRF